MLSALCFHFSEDVERKQICEEEIDSMRITVVPEIVLSENEYSFAVFAKKPPAIDFNDTDCKL